MIVKFTNLYKLIPNKNNLFKKIFNQIKNNNLVGGKNIQSFEDNFSRFTGSRYCVALANGTDAIEIALESLKIKKGSEIIVPVNTWISTAETVVRAGYKLVFCDVNLDDYTISLEDLKKKINTKTSAIIIVHLYGNVCDVKNIKKIINKRNIKIIEDCAQSHGSTYKKTHVGNFGHIGTFSFFPSKNLGALGDAGAIITNNKSIYNYCIRVRNHGALNKYDHKFPGRNSRMDVVQSIVISEKLKKFKYILNKRKIIANIYFKYLKNTSAVNVYNLKKNYNSSFHQFVIRVKSRDKLRIFLKKNKIETMIHYPYMLDRFSFFKNPKKKTFHFNSFGLEKKILSLPISEEHSLKQIHYVCKCIINFYKK
jgi:dTDP-4-amino-4,6-dideoxygalactose transaminase